MKKNMPKFDEIDILRVFLKVNKFPGRKQLAAELDIGEGSLRSILDILKKKRLLESNYQGHKLSKTGEKKFNVPNPMGAKSAGGNIPNPMGGKINIGQSKAIPGKFNAPNEWGVQPLNLPKPQQQPQQIQQPQQAQLEDFQQEESEEEPYWSAEEWEQWAYEIATVNPEAQQYLPPWFMQALKEEEQ